MKIEVENISFKKYLSITDRSKTDYYLKYGNFKVVDYFKLGSFMNLSFGFVKDFQEILNYQGLTYQNYIEIISKYKKILISDIALIGIFDLHQSMLFVKDEIQKINKLESENLGHDVTSEEENAGIEIFSKYRSFLQFDNLTGGDITKIKKIRRMEYSVCFAKMLLDADRNQFETNLFKLRNKT